MKISENVKRDVVKGAIALGVVALYKLGERNGRKQVASMIVDIGMKVDSVKLNTNEEEA